MNQCWWHDIYRWSFAAMTSVGKSGKNQSSVSVALLCQVPLETLALPGRDTTTHTHTHTLPRGMLQWCSNVSFKSSSHFLPPSSFSSLIHSQLSLSLSAFLKWPSPLRKTAFAASSSPCTTRYRSFSFPISISIHIFPIISVFDYLFFFSNFETSGS